MVMVIGAAIILLWIGLFKFTEAEAKAIVSLVENHPLTFWAYRAMSVQTVSNIVGTVEVLIALGLVLSLRFEALRRVVGIGLVLTFTVTLSYLFTTPGMFSLVEGFPVTDFFILKDIAYLGLGLVLLGSGRGAVSCRV
ncbi:MAG: hypothetical protein CSA07_01430 [Bacteroidia bacterium]|nr:MAG: hypothetical protein CSA07_01430 [Bacteroidia bacterium]